MVEELEIEVRRYRNVLKIENYLDKHFGCTVWDMRFRGESYPNRLYLLKLELPITERDEKAVKMYARLLI